jgi:hypothetical protein
MMPQGINDTASCLPLPAAHSGFASATVVAATTGLEVAVPQVQLLLAGHWLDQAHKCYTTAGLLLNQVQAEAQEAVRLCHAFACF